DQVGAVLDLPERACHLTDALEGHARGAVADRSFGIDACPDAIGDGDSNALRLARGVRQAVDDRIPRPGENARGALNALLERGRLPVHQRGRAVLDGVVQEPRLAEDASV